MYISRPIIGYECKFKCIAVYNLREPSCPQRYLMEQGCEFSSGELELMFQGLKTRYVWYATCSQSDGGKNSSVAGLLCTLDQLFSLSLSLSLHHFQTCTLYTKT